MPTWERIVQLEELSGRTAVRVERNGHALCLALVGESPVAVTDVCAHRNIALSGGLVRDGILTCPGHFWRYDLRTGQCVNRPDRVATHPCRVSGSWVDVLVPDPEPVLGIRTMLLAAVRREQDSEHRLHIQSSRSAGLRRDARQPQAGHRRADTALSGWRDFCAYGALGGEDH